MNIESILIEILVWMLVIAAVCTVAVALYGILMDRRHVKKLVSRELENERRIWLDARKEEADPLPLGVTRLKGLADKIRVDSQEEEKPIDEIIQRMREGLEFQSSAHYAAFEAVCSASCEPVTASDVASVIGYSTSHTRRLLNQLVSEGYIKEDSLKVPYTFRIPDLPDSLS